MKKTHGLMILSALAGYVLVGYAMAESGLAATLGLEAIPRKIFLGGLIVALAALVTLKADSLFAPTVSKWSDNYFEKTWLALSEEAKCKLAVLLYGTIYAATVISLALV